MHGSLVDWTTQTSAPNTFLSALTTVITPLMGEGQKVLVSCHTAGAIASGWSSYTGLVVNFTPFGFMNTGRGGPNLGSPDLYVGVNAARAALITEDVFLQNLVQFSIDKKTGYLGPDAKLKITSGEILGMKFKCLEKLVTDGDKTLADIVTELRYQAALDDFDFAARNGHKWIQQVFGRTVAIVKLKALLTFIHRVYVLSDEMKMWMHSMAAYSGIMDYARTTLLTHHLDFNKYIYGHDAGTAFNTAVTQLMAHKSSIIADAGLLEVSSALIRSNVKGNKIKFRHKNDDVCELVEL